MNDPEFVLPGQTPIDPNERRGLIPEHVKLISELNEFEEVNIRSAMEKYLSGPRRKYTLDDPECLKRIHKDMLGQTWKWAGTYRTSDKNLGKPWTLIPEEVKKACDDFHYWKENGVYDDFEIAVRFHHRLVSIHPFPNGNGRHARLVADIFLRVRHKKPLTWGGAALSKQTDQRAAYIEALKKADQGDLEDLIRFAKS